MVVIWSAVIDLVGSLVTSASWLDRLSIFHYLALAPAAPVHATTVIITTATAVALGAVAVALFARRDLAEA